MLKIHLPPEIARQLSDACTRSGKRETGGMLFGEHVAQDEFRVAEITVADTGTLASFVRALTGSLSRLEQYFRRTRHDYRRFNYLGEWHSHPSFTLYPSHTDDESMFDIVTDSTTNARFVIAIIVKLENRMLCANAFAYFPDGFRQQCEVVMA